MIKIFVGYDDRMPVLHHVLSHSIIARSSEPVAITPISLASLNGIFERDLDPNQSTQFSFSRFLVPYLSEYEGWSIFMDNDMLCLDDIKKLWDMRDDRYAVMCIKHEYEIKEDTKFLGAKQTSYQKKNWSSVMLLNNAKCRSLTPDFVNAASGLELHQFKWLESDDLIGGIPNEWNYLAGYYPYKDKVSLVHYTDGGPYFDDYQDCDYSQQWLDEKSQSLYVKSK